MNLPPSILNNPNIPPEIISNLQAGRLGSTIFVANVSNRKAAEIPRQLLSLSEKSYADFNGMLSIDRYPLMLSLHVLIFSRFLDSVTTFFKKNF